MATAIGASAPSLFRARSSPSVLGTRSKNFRAARAFRMREFPRNTGISDFVKCSRPELVPSALVTRLQILRAGSCPIVVKNVSTETGNVIIPWFFKT